MVSLASTNRAAGDIAPSVGGSLKRKKSRTLDSSDNEQLSSSQVKRRRVTFDPSVDVHILPDAYEKSLELVGEDVRRALEKHVDKDSASYDDICSLLVTKPTSTSAPLTSLLHKYIIALSNNVPLLDHRSFGMVHAIIDCHWVARNEAFVRSYRHLLRSILSMHTGYTASVFTMLLEMFLRLPPVTMRQQDDPPVSSALIQTRVHDCLKYLLRRNPMMSTLLSPIISSIFPAPSDTAKAHVRYISNILRVAQYCPEIKNAIKSLIMDRLVKIDSQIQVDLDEYEDDIEDLLMEKRVGDDEEDEENEDEDSDNESVYSEGDLSAEEQRSKEVKESISKLDAIMDILFTHYDSVFQRGNVDEIYDTRENLLAQFINIILPTYRSRHAQFILFHFAQTSPDTVDWFAGHCSRLVSDRAQPRILQIAAAAYLASFTARGAHVSAEVVRDVFDILCKQLDGLRIEQEPSCKSPDLQRFGSYYATAQAILYIFCFRWRDLIVTDDGSIPTDEDILYHEGDFRWYHDIQDTLRRNIFSKLNPLKICAPTIVAQFATMAHHLRFLYIFPKLETNKRIRLSRSTGGASVDGVAARETALSMKSGEQTLLLDAYFPFDPYLLPRSRHWIEQDYVEWKPVPGMKAPRSDDDDKEEEESEEEDDDDESDSSDSDREPLALEEEDDEEDLDDDQTSDPSF